MFTRTNVVFQPFPEAICAIEPPPALTLASTGTVVKVPGGVKRMPSALTCPARGVKISIVPRTFAVAGYWLTSTNAACPLAARGRESFY